MMKKLIDVLLLFLQYALAFLKRVNTKLSKKGDVMMSSTCKRIMVTGLVGGFIGGAIKMGWEALVPPRTPEREEEPPPMTLLNQLGLPEKVKHATYNYNQNEIPIAVMGIHYGFSIAHAFAYAILAERYSKVTVLRGSLFGIAINIAFHEYLLPRVGLTPEIDELPKEERISELLGHIVWMNTIDYVRSALK